MSPEHQSICELNHFPQMSVIRHSAREERPVLSLGAEMKNQWKKLGLAIGVGLFFGIAAAALGSRGELMPSALDGTRVSYAIPATPSGQVSPSKTRVNNTEELEKLQARNRRLEALVAVLRRRGEHPGRVSQSRGVSERINEAGQ